jgi:hypothetical protein
MILFRRLVFPLCLLVGALLTVVAGVLHPDLPLDGAAQLAEIARHETWRAVHWTFLFGFPLALTGLAGVVGRHVGTAGERAARAGLVVATFAYGLWVIIVAFMAGAGWSLAQGFAVSDAGMTATRAVFVFDMLRPFALVAQRAAGFALGIATALFGWGVLEGRVLPRWLGAAGAVSGALGIALTLVFREDTRADQAAFVLPVLWQVATGAVLLRVPATND